jgi:hypothetical protein
MAIYRFEAKVISRSGGRGAVSSAAYRTGKCATSAAAYRAGAKLTDERTGESYDYTRKGGIAGAEIITPEGAPAWMQDRSRLWNEVEKVEKRKDAQLARDFIISLPHELTAEQREALTKEFVREQFAARGYVADIAWHSPDKGEGLNHHAHVMVPLRKVEGNGFAAKKERAPEGQHPAAAWKDELGHLREAWANTANRHLERAGLDIRLDHRSLAERGIDREPEPKQGPLATQIEREGRESFAGNDRRAVKARNELKEIEATLVSFELIQAKQAQAEAELTRTRAFEVEAKAAGMTPAELRQERRQEAREARMEGQQEAWRAQVAGQDPDKAKPVQQGLAKGLEVVDGMTGAVSKLGDFMNDLVAGVSPSPGPTEKAADMRAFATDPQARKEQILARQAAREQAEADGKAVERIAEDMKAGKALSASDIKSLTPAHQMQIKNFGDDGVRQMVEEAQKRAEHYWKGSGRERD